MQVQFTTDNAALDDGTKPAECARIRRQIADALERGAECGAIRDTNGNIVGRWSL